MSINLNLYLFYCKNANERSQYNLNFKKRTMKRGEKRDEKQEKRKAEKREKKKCSRLRKQRSISNSQ